MKKPLTQTITTEHPLEYLLRGSLCVVLCGALAAYMMLISLSVVHVVARKEANRASTATASRIADLERELFSLTTSVAPERASALGLVPVSDKHFVTRTVTLGQASGVY